MLEWRSYVVGTCHGMSPKVMLMRGVALADMPWHVPTTMSAFLKLETLHHDMADVFACPEVIGGIIL